MNKAGWLGAVVCAGMLLAPTRPLYAQAAPPAQAPSSQPAKGVSTREARDDALRSAPRDKLDRQTRARVDAVLKDVTVFRRLPAQAIECDPKMYLFLVENPQVVVGLWRAMGVSEMTLTRSQDGVFTADDAAGTHAQVECVYRSADTHIFLADGKYHGALFTRPVEGKCLLVLRSGYVREPSGRRFVICRLDAFLQVKHLGAELLARAFQPLVGQTADHNFRETTAFLEKLHEAAVRNPAGVQRLGAKMEGVDERQVLEFHELSGTAAARATLASSMPVESSEMADAPLPTAPRQTVAKRAASKTSTPRRSGSQKKAANKAKSRAASQPGPKARQSKAPATMKRR